MSNRLEVGGLAVIVGSVHCPENIGKVVELLAFVPAGTEASDPDGFEYIPIPADGWLVGGNSFTSSFENDGKASGFRYSRVRSCFLMPIGRDPDAETRQTEQPIDAVSDVRQHASA